MHPPARLMTLLLFALIATSLAAQTTAKQGEGTADAWALSAAEIPMRDEVKLHTVIAAPRHVAVPLPVLLQRTPYGVPDGLLGALPADIAQDLAESGFIQVAQDIRGRHKSEGAFVMLRPPHAPKDARGIDESTDAYDTIDWLLRHVPGHNGRVGIRGGSYDAWLAAMALIHPHPALRAASIKAAPADMFLGDDFHHNGAFRLSYGFEYVWMLESGKEQNANWPIDLPDAYDWYLRLGPLANVDARYLHGTRPSWNDFVAHPNYEHPEAIPSNRVQEYRIDMHAADHAFLKGHRIGVQIQSAWFPLIDRNPQRFVPNIFAAKAEDFAAATQRIYRSSRHCTHLVLPVRQVPGVEPMGQVSSDYSLRRSRHASASRSIRALSAFP